jgi:predicted deacetylase
MRQSTEFSGGVRYLVRFDDICPTMNWTVWERVENILQRFQVQPILAVVPDNRDPKLMVEAAVSDFWDRVRQWQSRGWTIGWHGFQHRYETVSGGLIGIHAGSEFAELDVNLQREKLAAASRIFREQGVSPSVWVAPGHSFDAVTVGLLPEFGIRVISDGFFWRPVSHRGCIWIPQQLWRFRSMPRGTWTVCCHVNSWGDAELGAFERGLQRHASSIVGLESVAGGEIPRQTWVDSAFSALYRRAVLRKMGKAVHLQ